MKRFAALLAFHVVVSASASAQDVRYRAPDGSIKTVSSAEHQSRVAEIRTLIDDLNNNRRVILTVTDTPVAVTNARLHEIAGWLERKGGLTALEIPGWIDEQMKKSRDMIPALTEELEGLTSHPTSVGGEQKVEWPVPMEWPKVKATLHLDIRTICQSSARSAILQDTGRLDLHGDASVDLVFSAGTSDEASISGSIIPTGLAAGQGRMAYPKQQVAGVYRWQITLNRMNDELVIQSYAVTYVPDQAELGFCEPTRIIAGQDPDADQFPEPMSWLSARGEVRGDYSILCSGEKRLEGAFTVQLAGNGTVAATFEQTDPEERVLASGKIQDRDGEGFAELSGPGSFGRYNWILHLRREGSKIGLAGNDSDLSVVPNDRALECYVPVLTNTR